MSKWQKIETAPKDAVEILLWFPFLSESIAGPGKGSIFIGYWGYPEDGDACWLDPNDGEILGDYATHWCPLPEPPS